MNNRKRQWHPFIAPIVDKEFLGNLTIFSITTLNDVPELSLCYAMPVLWVGEESQPVEIYPAVGLGVLELITVGWMASNSLSSYFCTEELHEPTGLPAVFSVAHSSRSSIFEIYCRSNKTDTSPKTLIIVIVFKIV